jgi:nicotinamide-nucleotide amidase
MLPTKLIDKSISLLELLRKKKLRLATAESCTGGLIAMAITEIPGASEVFERGFITYSNDAKIDLLTVPTFYIEDYDAVSKEVAIAMAEGALLMSRADVSVSVTGSAGPSGGTEEKPLGTVFIGCAMKNRETLYEQFSFQGNRHEIRLQAAEAAFNIIEKLVAGK